MTDGAMGISGEAVTRVVVSSVVTGRFGATMDRIQVD
jgi:hypothetical protein